MAIETVFSCLSGQFPKLVVIGKTDISPWMRGKRMPMRKVVQRIIERASETRESGLNKLVVTIVDEHCTTKMCSICNKENIVGKKKTRKVYCPNCKMSWNRDVNAGRNILHIGLILRKIMDKKSIPNAKNFRVLKNLFPLDKKAKVVTLNKRKSSAVKRVVP